MSELGKFPWDSDLVLLVDGTDDLIRKLWALGYREAAWGVLDADFEVPFERAAAYAMARAGWLVKETEGVTRERIQDLLARTLGPTYANPDVADVDLAAAIAEEFAGMADWRAAMIARTETAYAAAFGAIAAFKEGGIEQVLISDGTTSDDPCIAANGQTWSLAEYEANPLEHPNCSRAAIPIVV